jgi:hypothetical protein
VRKLYSFLVIFSFAFLLALSVQAAVVSATFSDYGARGDGIHDDSASIQQALASLPAGSMLDGEGKAYRVTGTFHIRRDLTLKNAVFLQNSPAEQREGPRSVRTLLIRGEAGRPIRIVLENIVVHRGENPHQGSPNDAAGIWIDNVVDSQLHGIEITGNGRGAGLLLGDANNVEIRNLWVHDMAWAPCLSQPEGLPWDEIRHSWNTYQVIPMDNCAVRGRLRVRIQEPLSGLIVVRSRHVRIIDPVIERLHAIFSDGRRAPWQTDGMTIGSGQVDADGKSIPADILIRDARVSQVWEGIDIAGHPVHAVRIENTKIDDIHAFGIKVANGAADIKIQKAKVSNSGIAAFVVSGKNTQAITHPATHQVSIQESLAINTGSNRYWHGQATIAGFRVMSGRVSGPIGVRIIRSTAIDEQNTSTMRFGFHSECRSSMVLDETSAYGYITAHSRVESLDCANDSELTSPF